MPNLKPIVALLTLTGVLAAVPTPAEPVTDQRTLLVQLAVTDLDRSVAFYRDVVGLEIESVNEAIKWARVKTGIPSVTIGLGESPEAKGSGTVSLNFGVRNIEHARATLEARGVEFLGPTITIPGVVKLADFLDPDGNKIRIAGHSGE
ncbi:MAG: VOC family protein [Phycisphaerales bacterium]|nr:VOC family protein [Phycisphaerae bacterium]NNF43502.1 VOC family protein [Phycisphaerales bacterium]NNM26830.1 VOC family protein [Phycisphaerales bacterium]